MLPFAPRKREEGQAPDYREAWEYYHTPRAQHPNAPSIVPVHSLNRMVAYDAFHLAEQLLTQPLRLIAGSKAGSLWFSQDAFRRSGSRDKSLHIVEAATHIAMTRPNTSSRPWLSSCRFTKTQARLPRRATSSGR